MKIKVNDIFGFQNTINFDKLDNPETLNQLAKMFNVNNERQVSPLKRGLIKPGNI